MFLRGGVNAAGSPNAGDGGFTSALTGVTNVYTVTYSAAFLSGDIPIVLITPVDSGVNVGFAIGTNTNSAFNCTFNGGGITTAFYFLALGQAP